MPWSPMDLIRKAKDKASVIIDVIDGQAPDILAVDRSMSAKVADGGKKTLQGQDWGNTPRNALRHAYWSGRMAQEIGPTAAKAIGWTNEAIGVVKDAVDGKPHDWVDMRLDLNNNSIGVKAGNDSTNKQQLVSRIRGQLPSSPDPVTAIPGAFSGDAKRLQYIQPVRPGVDSPTPSAEELFRAILAAPSDQ